VQEMQKKETVKQSCSNMVASLEPSAFAKFTRVLGPFREIPGTFPPKSSILPGGKMVSRKDVSMWLIFLMLLLCLGYVAPMGVSLACTMWCFYGLSYAIACACLPDTSMLASMIYL
jgi:hypothetical protein